MFKKYKYNAELKYVYNAISEELKMDILYLRKLYYTVEESEIKNLIKNHILKNFFKLDDEIKISKKIIEMFNDEKLINRNVKEEIIEVFFRNLDDKDTKNIIFENKVSVYNVFRNLYNKYHRNPKLFSKKIVLSNYKGERHD